MGSNKNRHFDNYGKKSAILCKHCFETFKNQWGHRFSFSERYVGFGVFQSAKYVLTLYTVIANSNNRQQQQMKRERDCTRQKDREQGGCNTHISTPDNHSSVAVITRS